MKKTDGANKCFVSFHRTHKTEQEHERVQDMFACNCPRPSTAISNQNQQVQSIAENRPQLLIVN
ncbi:MAG: hypothetical protein LBN30_03065, partial [Oscillospiraceae bacterium]|nr:hypothetical protein [Oscillospiraceae bacterium]